MTNEKNLSGHSYPFTFYVFEFFFIHAVLCKAISYHVCSYHDNKLLQCLMFIQHLCIKLAMCSSHGFSSDVCMRNFVHEDLFRSLLLII